MEEISKQSSFPRPALFALGLVVVMLLAACGAPVVEPTPTATTAAEEVAAADVTPTNDVPEVLPPPIIVEVTQAATATPEASPTAEASPTPEATATEEFTRTPEPILPSPTAVPPTAAPVQPTAVPPTPVPPTAVPPTEPPPPPMGANGLVASHFALQDRSDFRAGQPVWFEFTLQNSTGGEVAYNALGVMPSRNGEDFPQWYQQTYGGRDSTIGAAGFSWEDNIKIPEPGEYELRLVMCFDGFDPCLQQRGTWVTMSPAIPVRID